MVGSGQDEMVLEEVIIAGALESSAHVGSGPLGYGTSGVMTDVVERVVAGYMPEPIEELVGPSSFSGED